MSPFHVECCFDRPVPRGAIRAGTVGARQAGPAAQKPREQHDLGPERRTSRLPRERRAQRGLGALDFALVAQDFAEVGGGERIVRLQRERAGERALRLCELAEGALRIAEIVPGARVIGLD